MTEWDASGYARVSELQQVMAEEALALTENRLLGAPLVLSQDGLLWRGTPRTMITS